MSDELVAIVILIAWNVISFVLSLFIFRWIYEKESQKLLEQFNIEAIKEEFESLVHDKMQEAIDAVGGTLQELFLDPTTKKAFSILGSQGGEARAEKAVVDSMAMDLIDSPQFSAIRMGAEALGLDIEGYIEKHGAIKTLTAAQQLAKVAGLDIMKMDLSSLSLPGGSGAPSSGSNPYLPRR